MSTPPLGLIGVGLLGSALAERFLATGLRVLGFDLQPERRQALAQLGGSVAESAGEIVADCTLIVLCLPDSDAVTSVLDEIGPRLRPGQAVVDTTTGDPERTAAVGQALHDRGIVFVDATILGSSAEARAGSAIVMAGGESEHVELLGQNLFRCFARECHHTGPWGSGARMKLVLNLVLGLNRAVLAEGLALAQRCGLDPARTLEILRSGAAYARVMDTKGAKMLAHDFTPQARLAQHLKDVGLILAEAQRVGARVPLTGVHRDLLELVVRQGGGDQDNSAILRAFEG